jgi:transposase
LRYDEGVHKTFKYRLFPTPAQETALRAPLEECRWLYNHFLEERKTSCVCCGLEIDRDLNAALNILRLGLQSLATA